uniref:Translational activator of cytochrome c oxidase 1 n=1 Tax=Panagrolaimus sp. ES5 TaxID=591445 RepID=A0AC34FEG4_9BILA
MFGRLAGVIIRRQFSYTAETLKGHSKWQNIKDTKGKNDQARSLKTNQLLKKVKSAAQSGGFDLKLNRKLADLQQEFRSAGLSLDSFNSYLTKLKSKPDLTFHFDMIGPSGSFFIIEAEGDSKSKIQGSITKALKKIGHFRYAPDSLMNRFEEKGIVRIDGKSAEGKEVKVEDVEELAIELDCEEVAKVDEEDGPKLEFTTEVGNLNKVESALSQQGYNVEMAESQLIPLHPVIISDAEATIVGQFYEQLQEIEEIKQIFDNVESQAPQQASASA